MVDKKSMRQLTNLHQEYESLFVKLENEVHSLYKLEEEGNDFIRAFLDKLDFFQNLYIEIYKMIEENSLSKNYFEFLKQESIFNSRIVAMWIKEYSDSYPLLLKNIALFDSIRLESIHVAQNMHFFDRLNLVKLLTESIKYDHETCMKIRTELSNSETPLYWKCEKERRKISKLEHKKQLITSVVLDMVSLASSYEGYSTWFKGKRITEEHLKEMQNLPVLDCARMKTWLLTESPKYPNFVEWIECIENMRTLFIYMASEILKEKALKKIDQCNGSSG